MKKNTSKDQIWHKIIRAFNKSKLNYILVGGAALIVHGLPRNTLDLDIYIPAREDTLNKLFKIAGTLSLETKQKDILKISHLPDLLINQWISFSHKGQEILDIFLAKENDFNKLYKNSELKKDRTMSIRVASLNSILNLKKSSRRPIDKADIELIKEAKRYK